MEEFRNQTIKLKDHIEQTKKFYDDYKECKSIANRLDDTTVLRQTYNLDKNHFNEQFEYIKFALEDLNLNQNTTDNYLDKYIPFRIQNFISENLEVVLSKQKKLDFMDFEKRKYRHMHAKILNDEGFHNLDKKPSNLRMFKNDLIPGVNEHMSDKFNPESFGIARTQSVVYRKTSNSMISKIESKVTNLK